MPKSEDIHLLFEYEIKKDKLLEEIDKLGKLLSDMLKLTSKNNLTIGLFGDSM